MNNRAYTAMLITSVLVVAAFMGWLLNLWAAKPARAPQTVAVDESAATPADSVNPPALPIEQKEESAVTTLDVSRLRFFQDAWSLHDIDAIVSKYGDPEPGANIHQFIWRCRDGNVIVYTSTQAWPELQDDGAMRTVPHAVFAGAKCDPPIKVIVRQSKRH